MRTCWNSLGPVTYTSKQNENGDITVFVSAIEILNMKPAKVSPHCVLPVIETRLDIYNQVGNVELVFPERMQKAEGSILLSK